MFVRYLRHIFTANLLFRNSVKREKTCRITDLARNSAALQVHLSGIVFE